MIATIKLQEYVIYPTGFNILLSSVNIIFVRKADYVSEAQWCQYFATGLWTLVFLLTNVSISSLTVDAHQLTLITELTIAQEMIKIFHENHWTNSIKIITHIYYRDQKVNNLIMKNNFTQKDDILTKAHVIVYETQKRSALP